MTKQPTPIDIIRAALEPGLKGGIAQNRAARVLDALTAAGLEIIPQADIGSVSRNLADLRDLAHVLDAQIDEGTITPQGMGLVLAALARVYPSNIHTGERCQTAECLVHGPCEECPTEAQWQACDDALTTWLAEHPREVTIYKPQACGRSDQLPDLRPWQPAGAYPIDGTIIDVRDRGRMRYSNHSASAHDRKYHLGGWIIDDGKEWVPAPPPTTRWRKAPPVEA